MPIYCFVNEIDYILFDKFQYLLMSSCLFDKAEIEIFRFLLFYLRYILI